MNKLVAGVVLLIFSRAFAAPGDTFHPRRYHGAVELLERTRSDRAPPPRLLHAAAADFVPVAAEQPTRRWLVELDASLKRRARAGNLLFVLSARGAANGLDECTNLYQTDVGRIDAVAAELELTADDGFEPGHTYHLRVLQLIRGREVVLAETDVLLL